jgi:sugar O-acyltransferase (sialic acid O-acetyltransferase NeuD family)
MRIVILGAGGHGQVVADILWAMRRDGFDIDVIAFLDDDPALVGRTILDVPVLGPIADLASLPHDGVVVAIGDNRVRQRIFLKLQEQGEHFMMAKHPSAVVGVHALVGTGTVIAANAVVNTGSVIGQNVIVNTACIVDHHSHVGNHAHIGPGAHLGGEVRVDEGALVGIGAIILPQRHVGHWSTVGAGAVVVKNVGDQVTVTGNPARPQKRKRQ